MGGLRGEFPHKLPVLETLRNLESPFVLWIQIAIYFLASTNSQTKFRVGVDVGGTLGAGAVPVRPDGVGTPERATLTGGRSGSPLDDGIIQSTADT